MNTIVCYKWVKEEEDIKVSPDGSIDVSKAQSKISEYDRNAIEACRAIAEMTGTKPVGLTFGGSDIAKAHPNALARGLEEGFGVADDDLAGKADAYVTANVLAAAIRKISDYNLVVFGEGASDTYAHQVGSRVGALLGLPVVSNVQSYEIAQGTANLTRKIGNVTETVEVKLPLVMTLLPEANDAPIPGLRAVLAAKKKPVTEYPISDLQLTEEELTPRVRVLTSKAYVPNRKRVMFDEGDMEEKVGKLLSALREEGVL